MITELPLINDVSSNRNLRLNIVILFKIFKILLKREVAC